MQRRCLLVKPRHGRDGGDGARADRGRVQCRLSTALPDGRLDGGYGVWSVAARRPGCFAAIVSICGGSPLPPRASERFTRIAKQIGKTPVWIFHGEDDPIVPVTESRQMVAALEAVGGDIRYSEYPGVGHSVWR
ncbi:MAG TPA: dienelactone hydrolase family protein [Pyrinomonadaceae bacterium]